MPEANNKVLSKMLERLFASMVNGPSLNCRPHSSRQRVDVATLSRFRDVSPEEALRKLLSDEREVKLAGKVAQPKRRRAAFEKREVSAVEEAAELTPEQKAAEQAYSEQQALLNKLRIIAEDAKTYEQDTGVHVLNIGFPLLSMPPGSFGGQRGVATRRVIAPIAFIPVTLTVKAGATQAVEIACRGDGIDLVTPNTALLAWLEQQTGTPAVAELFADEHGAEPWREVCELVQRVCRMLEIAAPELFKVAEAPAEAAKRQAEGEGASAAAGDATATRQPLPQKSAIPEALKLQAAPRSEEADAKPTVITCAVLGLFPTSNQGLLRDVQAMVAGESLAGPVESFIRADASLDQPVEAQEPQAALGKKQPRVFADERLVTLADPCQSRAVKLARECKGLVIHGPPGTGKSQTITNIIGDHLSRGQRVLLVCDKRTALDVVANRLEHMGLGRLCAVVHDPQRDQRDLYKSIREQLDNLTETTSDAKAEKKLAKVDDELQELHAELTQFWTSLMAPGANGTGSFHDLVGEWLGLSSTAVASLDASALKDVTLEQLDKAGKSIHEVLERGRSSEYPQNPWVGAAGISLADFIARPMTEFRTAMNATLVAAEKADGTLHPSIPPFDPDLELPRQAQARTDLAERLRDVLGEVKPEVAARWAKQNAAALGRARDRLNEAKAPLEVMRAVPLDTELSLFVRSGMPSMGTISQQLAALDAYIGVAEKWYAFLAFGKKAAAGAVLRTYGLPLDIPSAQRVRTFLLGLRARLTLGAIVSELQGSATATGIAGDTELEEAIASQQAIIELLAHVQKDPAFVGLHSRVAPALIDGAAAASLLDGLDRSPERARGLRVLETALAATRLFDGKWLGGFTKQSRFGEVALPVVASLNERLDTLNDVLRIRERLREIPRETAIAVEELLKLSVGPEEGTGVLRKSALATEIGRQLQSDTILQAVDAQRLKTSFDRYRKLDAQKKDLVRDTVVHRWTARQKERLLAGTGSRLNGLGADLRRRLTMRGERAMRLRQVISVGQAIEGGDPLFDVCPVWLASPETVAQIFPRQALFSAVIFDEASQCRLEEALPVLCRAERVVIAGDPKQLPPTRFFESALAVSEDDEIETEQQLFEHQQGEVEDLLGAALNLSIEQSYLDVHYRSRNADLIEFSNEHFYGSRLQPIPGHPSNRTRYAPLTLYRADGVYDKRENPIEADAVVRIVRDLLKRAKAPSIGIACFNLQQRDLIVEKLEELAGEDADFGRRLAESRTRVGAGSFEGLFVKNLENVQGDERDHIIISTTYGPDPKGRFYQRFGPVGRAGGGRRLNVLVTRAREEVHLVTSIPRSAYQALPPIPPGQTAGGGWLLFSYLAYAEQLAGAYEKAHDEVEQEQATHKPVVRVRPTKTPSVFSEAFSSFLHDRHNIGSDVHWGNDGFMVDVALHHPKRPDDVTLGILCDAARFTQAQDPVEWDIFRTAIHESQGWKLHRIWTPQFFRDPEGSVEAVLKNAKSLVKDRDERDAIRVRATTDE